MRFWRERPNTNNRRNAEKYKIEGKAHARLSKLDTSRILDWCDQAGTGMAFALREYRRDARAEALEDARSGAITLLVALEILQDRSID